MALFKEQSPNIPLVQFTELQDLEAGTLLYDVDGDLMMVVWDNTAERNSVVHLIVDRSQRKHNYPSAAIWGEPSHYFPAAHAKGVVLSVTT